MFNKATIYSSITLPAAILMVLSMVLGNNTSTQAQKIPGPTISDELKISSINRVEVLEKFFDKYNSPLKAHADTFVEIADKYGFDYSLLPAISCIESTCGKKIIPGSYNPFGWGIHGNNFIAFNNFDEAIETVGMGLNEMYFSRGLDTPAKIAPVYTPPNGNHWLNGVTFFINKIDKEELSTITTLASNIEISE